jgi:hypothetical protein
MGQSSDRAQGRAQQDAREQAQEALESMDASPDGLPRLDLLQFTGPDAQANRERTTVALPGGTSVVIQGMTRGEFVDLGISDDTDARDDEARILESSVVEPAATADEWKAALAAMPPGVASVLLAAVMEANGLGGEVGRRLARDFRA